MLLFNNASGCITMGGGNASDPGADPDAHAALPPALSLFAQDAARLAQAVAASEAGAPVLVRMRMLELPPVDAGAALLWAIAVACVAGGALWAGEDHHAARKAAAAAASSGTSGGGGGAAGAEVVDITAGAAVWFVVAASGMLLLLFFLASWVLTLVMVGVFALAGAQALAAALLPLAAAAAPAAASRMLQLPVLGETSLAQLLAGVVSVAAAGVWLVCRNAGWAWLLHDTLGVALLLLMLRTLRLGGLRVACVLLPLCFFYDVFWVFLSPYLFKGESVMVQVASGGGGEPLPMLLRVPHFGAPPGFRGYSMLGFGDVILPGLLVAWCRRLDIDWAAPLGASSRSSGGGGGSSSSTGCGGGGTGCGGYFVHSLCGYAVGLCLTYTALYFSWFGDQGQPALLYLVPCCLGWVLLLGLLRGQLRAMWAYDGQCEYAEMGAWPELGDEEEPLQQGQQQQQQRSQQRGGSAPRGAWAAGGSPGESTGLLADAAPSWDNK